MEFYNKFKDLGKKIRNNLSFILKKDISFENGNKQW